MYVKIGPYRNWIGPYQIAGLLEHVGVSEDRCFQIGEWLAGPPGNDSLFLKLCLWLQSKQDRKIVVRIDKYDTWSMDHTLSHIIVPMLKQLKETTHGSPIVEDSDVPEELRNSGEEDNVHKRWRYILDEMIWAFEQKLLDDWEGQYFDGSRILDKEGLNKHAARITNGFRLFGVYYEGLWD